MARSWSRARTPSSWPRTAPTPRSGGATPTAPSTPTPCSSSPRDAMSRDRRLLVVLGMMGRCPFGGQTWLYLNWLRGPARLGHEVYYVEDDATWPYDPRVDTITDDPGYAVGYLKTLMERIGLADRWAYRPLYRGADECYGLSAPRLRELYASCDALLNVCGATVLNDDHRKARRRVYVETDPVTNQLELANGKQKTRAVLAEHDTLVTY